MHYLKNTPVVLATCILACALVIIGLLAYFAIGNALGGTQTLAVTGSAERIVESDSAKWMFSITQNAAQNELREATKTMQEKVTQVIAFLKTKGITDAEIERSAIDIQNLCFSANDTNFDKFGNRVCSSGGSYALSARIIVNTNQAKAIADISQTVTDFALSQNITLSGSSVEYYYTKLADLRVTLLADATKNAEERANAIAKSTGERLGKLKSASMGVFQVTAKQSVDFSDYGSYDTSTYEKKVTAIVRASFEIR